MPALPFVPSVMRVTLHQLGWGDNDVINRFYIKFAGAASATDQNAYCENVWDAWAANIKAQITGDVQLNQVSSVDLSSDIGAVGLYETAPVPGTGSASTPALAVVVQYKIGRHYRGGHPRLYMAGPQVAEIATSGLWEGAYLTALETAWLAFFDAITGAGPGAMGELTNVNVSYYDGFTSVKYPSGRYKNVPTLRADPLVDTVTAYAINAKPASQRRRNLQNA